MMISRPSQKIAISFVVVLSLSLVMIIFDLSRMRIMQSKLDIITQEHNIKSGLMVAIRHGSYERQVSLRNILLMHDPFERDEEKIIFDSYAVKIANARNKFSSMPLNKIEQKILDGINAAMALTYGAQIYLIETSIYGEEEEITKETLQRAFFTQEIFIGKVEQMIMLQNEATKKAVMGARESYQSAKSSVYILGGSALLLGLLVAIIVIRFTESQARDVNNAMAEIEQSNSLLEHRVQKRTEELAQARDDALASSKSKDVFLATMSHELRTPLNVIIGYSELLTEMAAEEGNNKLVPDLNKIHDAAQHQLELINSVLDMSKIEEGKLEIHPVDFDVEMLMYEIDAVAKPLMLKNNNTFEVNGMPGIGMMYSDNIRIRQILLNILSNAAKFTEHGQVFLSVSKDQKGDEITFAVQDTGVGIPDSYVSELFEKFNQQDGAVARHYDGSGLGLSISKQLSKQLNGDITVTSKKENGSCFTLTLPVIYIE